MVLIPPPTRCREHWSHGTSVMTSALSAIFDSGFSRLTPAPGEPDTRYKRLVQKPRSKVASYHTETNDRLEMKGLASKVRNLFKKDDSSSWSSKKTGYMGKLRILDFRVYAFSLSTFVSERYLLIIFGCYLIYIYNISSFNDCSFIFINAIIHVDAITIVY